MREKLHFCAYILVVVGLLGCTNSPFRSVRLRNNITPTTGYTHDITAAQLGERIVVGTITARAGSGPFQQFCAPSVGTGGTTYSCACTLSWSISGNGGQSSTLTRNWVIKRATLTDFECGPSPSQNPSLPPSGTLVTLRITSNSGNSSALRIQPFQFNSGSAGAVSLVDFEGRGINNISRYSCYEKQYRGLSVKNRVAIGGQTIGNVNVTQISGSRFCPDTTGGSGQSIENRGGGGGCEVVPDGGAKRSSQSYYFSLYHPASHLEQLVGSNENYVCPTVRSSQVSVDSFYPLDQSFALFAQPTSNAVGVQSRAVLSSSSGPSLQNTQCFSTTQTPGDGSSILTRCIGYALRPNPDGSCSEVRFTDPSAPTGYVTRPTFRLRRFVALLPPTLSAFGRPMRQPQAIDIAYVLDRPVYYNNGNQQSIHGTIRGPLPCLSAQLDFSGMINPTSPNSFYVPPNSRSVSAPYLNSHLSAPWYYGTNNPLMLNKNIDGTSLPFTDSFNSQTPSSSSCSATIPLISWNWANGSAEPLATYLRTTSDYVYSGLPGNPEGILLGGRGNFLDRRRIPMGFSEQYTPAYREDTSFVACALPALDPNPATNHPIKIIDPPIHTEIASATMPYPGPSRIPLTQVATWCTETKPTQNPRVDLLESTSNAAVWGGTLGGVVQNFTSHGVKGVVSSAGLAACTADISGIQIPSNYPNPIPSTSTNPNQRGIAHHSSVHSVITGMTASGIRTRTSASQTCDKTILSTSGDIPGFYQYPLLAPADDIERSLREFPDVYGCVYTSGEYKGLASPQSCCLYTTNQGAAHFEPTSQHPNCGFRQVPDPNVWPPL